MNIIIAGSREFNDYELLKIEVDKFLPEIGDIVIVSGTAKGADILGEKYAVENNIILHKESAKWDEFGKSAGYIRNEVMAKMSQACICFWDGKSKGTKHMIDLAIKYGLTLKIVKYE